MVSVKHPRQPEINKGILPQCLCEEWKQYLFTEAEKRHKDWDSASARDRIQESWGPSTHASKGAMESNAHNSASCHATCVAEGMIVQSHIRSPCALLPVQ